MTTASNNQDLIAKFYKAFAALDFETMRSCYHTDIEFEDGAFGPLSGYNVVDMWEMLITNSKRSKNPLRIEYSDVACTESTGSAHWEAWYQFAGNAVHNKIDAKFVFKDELIIKHVDSFDFWVWSSQYLGWTGYLLGWCSLLQNKVVYEARGKLSAFQAKKYGSGERI